MKFKVGDIVVAKKNTRYSETNGTKKWIGIVLMAKTGCFRAKTIFSKNEYSIGEVYDVNSFYFMTLNEAVKEGVKIEF